jgi:anthranilate phosphoribosyltransferase
VRLELPPARLGECLRTTGFAFLFAPSLHPAMRHAAAARRAVGVRTVFTCSARSPIRPASAGR